MGPLVQPDLWIEAYHKLRDKDKTTLPVLPLPQNTVPEDLLEIVNNELSSLRSKGMTIRLPNGAVFHPYDCMLKITRWLSRIVSTVDVIVQYDPYHAALPWAALRLILQTALNYHEKHVAVLEGIEMVTRSLAWAKIQEQLYLGHSLDHQIKECFVEFYSGILTLLAKFVRFARKPGLQKAVYDLFISDGKFRALMGVIKTARKAIEDCSQQMSRHLDIATALESVRLGKILQEIVGPIKRSEELRTRVEGYMANWEERMALDWVSTIPYDKHHKSVNSKALRGTGAWLFESDKFLLWRDSSYSQILRLHGIPGSGKSTLLSQLVESLRQGHIEQGEPYPAFFYCSRNPAEKERSDPQAVMLSLLKQLSSSPEQPFLHPALEKRHRERKIKGIISIDEATDSIVDMVNSRPVTFFLIDALDECDKDTRHDLTSSLERILDESRGLVKIFVTSRDDLEVPQLKRYPEIRISAASNKHDIEAYISDQIDHLIAKKRLLPLDKISEQLRGQIKERLREGAKGMFRWVELQLTSLCRFRSPHVLVQYLGQLPKELKEIYRDIYQQSLAEQWPEEQEITRRAFRWLLISDRRLSRQEFLVLVSRYEGSIEETLTQDRLLSYCSNLVEYDKPLDSFRFCHLSVREFFENSATGFDAVGMHDMAASTCLYQLQNLEHQDQPTYAQMRWTHHVRRMKGNMSKSTTETALHKFLGNSSQGFINWSNFMTLISRPKVWYAYKARSNWDLGVDDQLLFRQELKPMICREASPLFVACALDHISIASELLDHRPTAKHRAHTSLLGENALQVAVRYGSRSIIGLLFDRKFAGGAELAPLKSALTMAVEKNEPEIVRLLLANDVDANEPDTEGQLALLMAAKRGKLEMVRLLLDSNADVNVRDEFNKTALHLAADGGHQDLVEILLAKGIDVSMQDKADQTALQVAAFKGHARIVKVLLSVGSDGINTPNSYGKSALHIAAQNGWKDAVLALLEHGASVGIQDEARQTAIHAAAYKGHSSILHMLLQKDPNAVNLTDHLERTALHIAAERGHEKVAAMLYRAGANLVSKDLQGHTALDVAAQRGFYGIVERMKKKEVNIDLVEEQSWTTLELIQAGY